MARKATERFGYIMRDESTMYILPWSLFTAGENVVTWHRVSTWASPPPLFPLLFRCPEEPETS